VKALDSLERLCDSRDEGQKTFFEGGILTTAPKTDPDFAFAGTTFAAGPGPAAEGLPPTAGDDGYGPLAQLEGTWQGTGFNAIWRPNSSPGQDRFLELNITSETLTFAKIAGAIPNRGLMNPDINMCGLTYLQQVAEAQDNYGLHIEPGIWAIVPPTTDPGLQQTVVRMGSIPHGTVILAQGVTFDAPSGPEIDDNNIIPFQIGTDPPPNSDFDAAEKIFTELNLDISTEFRCCSPGVTQDMVVNPNSVLTAALAGQTITGTTVLAVSSQPHPVPGGGTANTAFLEAGSNPPGGNANAAEVDAVFWIETVTDDDGTEFLQLQYTQLVQLEFNGLRWPHVSVATLLQDTQATADS
jgi:hypothetical protein